MPDLGVHERRSRCSRWSDPAVHDAPIRAFTIGRNPQNYRTHRHNAVINAHRVNALKTFRAFAEGTEDDPQTKNAILLQAAQSVFAVQASGYLGDEPEPLPQSTIVEVLRRVGPAKE